MGTFHPSPSRHRKKTLSRASIQISTFQLVSHIKMQLSNVFNLIVYSLLTMAVAPAEAAVVFGRACDGFRLSGECTVLVANNANECGSHHSIPTPSFQNTSKTLSLMRASRISIVTFNNANAFANNRLSSVRLNSDIFCNFFV